MSMLVFVNSIAVEQAVIGDQSRLSELVKDIWFRDAPI